MAVALIAASVVGIGAIAPQESKNVAAAPARALSQAFREAAKAVQPAVVMIKSEPATAVKLDRAAPNDDGPSLGDGLGDQLREMPDLRRFFKEFPQQPKHGQSGLGSGMIIDPSGLVLTNNHVVAGGGEITVRLHDGREFKATHIMTDPKTDLAMLRIEGADHLTAAKLGDSDKVEVGDWVLALGHPFGLEGTVTAGIVSAKGRGIGINRTRELHSNRRGHQSGQQRRPAGEPRRRSDRHQHGHLVAERRHEGIGFAIPINVAKWVARQLEQRRHGPSRLAGRDRSSR